MPEFYADIVKEELNVKAVDFDSEAEKYVSYSFKPQLKTLGKRFGKNLGLVRDTLSSLDGHAAMAELNEKGILTININGVDEELSRDDLIISAAQSGDFEFASYGGVIVVLDKRLTPELIEEGFVRELVSKIQTMRKDSGFDVTDNINVYVSGNEKIVGVVLGNKDEISEDVLAVDFIFDKMSDNAKEWNINGEKVVLGVEKV